MMKEKIKENAKKLAFAGTTALTTVITTVPVLASETAGSADADVVSAMTGVAGDMVASGKAMIPIALTVVGIGLVVTFAIKIFKRVAK